MRDLIDQMTAALAQLDAQREALAAAIAGFTRAGEKATEQSRHSKAAAGIGLGSLAKE